MLIKVRSNKLQEKYFILINEKLFDLSVYYKSFKK